MQLLLALALIYLVYRTQQMLFAKKWDKNLTVSISFQEPVITEGFKSYLIEIVENKKNLPLPLLQVKFAVSSHLLFQKDAAVNTTDQIYRNNVYSIGKREKITRCYPFICNKRGCYELNRVDITTRDFFLEFLYAKQLSFHNTLIVRPGIFKRQEVPKNLTLVLNELVTPYAINEDVFEFKGIREYQPYDSIHFINWKQAAKLQTLMVNTHTPTSYLRASILLDLDVHTMVHPDILQEAGIKMANTIAACLSEKNIMFCVKTNANDYFDHKKVQSGYGAGKNHLSSLGCILARIDLKQPLSDFSSIAENSLKEISQRHLVIIITTHQEMLFPNADLIIIPVLAEKEHNITLNNRQILWEVTLDGKEI